jgi:diguanylate cyclase (GGDEF)-like protein/PAS domain S-box-containing protein
LKSKETTYEAHKSINQLIEKCICPTTKELANHFKDLSVSEMIDIFLGDINQIVYVSDVDTHEILYVNKTARKILNKDLIGNKCYEALQERTQPCEFCTNHIILQNKTKPYEWEYYNPVLDKNYLIIDKIIKWSDGRDVRFEFSIDITNLKKAKEEIKAKLLFEETLKKVSSRFINIDEFDQSMSLALRDIGIYGEASRTYIFRINKDHETMDNIYEWCKEPTQQQIHNLKDLKLNQFPWWMKKIYKDEIIYIEDASNMPKEAANEQKILESQDIKSLICIPMYVKDELYGFIGMDDAKENHKWTIQKLELLQIFSEIIGSAIERKENEIALKESENRYRSIFENIGVPTIIVNNHNKIILVNEEFENFSHYRKNEIEHKKYLTEFFEEKDIDKNIYTYFKEHGYKTIKNYETKIICNNHSIKNAILHISKIPSTNKNIISFLDISKQKEMEKNLRNLSYHDALTSLYNRAYLIEMIDKFEKSEIHPIGVISCDVDGLKLVNDTFGHETGDTLLKTLANILKDTVPFEDIIARIGGDEFIILLPNKNYKMTKKIYDAIKQKIEEHNKMQFKIILNASIGFSIKDNKEKTLKKAINEADHNMYREKLHHKQSKRNTSIRTLMKALEARDFITEGHGERLQDLITCMAKALNFSDPEIADLRLLGQFHDIGKVGIPDHILFKKGPLNDLEKKEMQRHSEIGYRITQSSPDLVPISDWVLKHHEWWNGEGYPLRLMGTEIPLPCRMLSIVDAYDAMTNDRPYRKKLSQKEAVQELKDYSNIQFDPKLVEIFITILNKKEENA